MRQPLRAVLLQVLEQCRRRGTLYPRLDGPDLGLPRGELDDVLDHLRLGGFLEMTEWEADRGQGYRLTEAGRAAAADPQLLDRPAAPPPGPPAADLGRPVEHSDEVLRAVFVPARPRVTPVLVGLNVLVYLGIGLYLLRSGMPLNLYLMGTDVPGGPLTRTIASAWLSARAVFVDGQWWR